LFHRSKQKADRNRSLQQNAENRANAAEINDGYNSLRYIDLQSNASYDALASPSQIQMTSTNPDQTQDLYEIIKENEYLELVE